MREVEVSEITKEIAELCQEANFELGEDVINAFKDGLENDESPTAKAILEQLLENAKIAREDRVPMCQDTGFTVIFVELGQEVKLVGGDLEEAINEGVRQGYKEGYLRKSIVSHPLKRENTGDNTPAVIHTKIVPGDKIKITVAPKGGGSENMSEVRMMKPADGVEGVKDFVIERVKESGPNPCPPIVVGVGIGGTFEKCAYLAKKALLRPIGDESPHEDIAQLEKELLEEVNKLGIGPQGLGGRTTVLDVNVEIYGAHIASLPVAVNINCHAARHKETII
ncbi:MULTISPECIES: fumarate hydratase [unclassified Candidatus Frackibacter]|uniref:fumarate hydratase n=1 Tax=unclassified Candidatus Frackibacter TaxID=2648818 RepID=UPI00087E164D|nr:MULTISPECIES: fumarate hydratase [unclassified Candidatus Frackibacter]SDC57274.1 fumarate hydratase subunit alpha [Candidatus Frackibacter sp. WG11]SEM71389.1 fumarate hydratase subunit alpha [Candidatus Frackibacter sp. WG12]SFL82875.1 fumarate hydratase subunit alpha [Candidatus Frackibacter sp. WG13]